MKSYIFTALLAGIFAISAKAAPTVGGTVAEHAKIYAFFAPYSTR